MRLFWIFPLGFLLSATSAQELAPFLDGLSQPTFLTHAGDGSGRLFIVERAGRILVVANGTVLDEPFLDIRGQVRTDGEFGMLGLAFHPNFSANRRFFVYYSPSDGLARTVISEFRASEENPNRAEAGEEVFFVIVQPFGNHNGGTIAFGLDGFLFLGLGDGGGGGDPLNNGQNLNTVLGAMLRLNVDGGSIVPPDNPFVGIEGRDEIWAYGFRNPFRFSFDRLTGRLFLGDVGQNTFEEVDIVEAGRNYGWDRMEGRSCFPPGSQCDMSGLTLPIHDYGRLDGASVTGGYVYRGSQNPSLVGAYVFGDFITGRIWALRETTPGIWGRQLLFGNTGLSIVAFGEDEAGELYVVDIGGRILRIQTVQDADGDGVLDELEDAGPNGGDANLDGVPDRVQSNVVAFKSLQGDDLVAVAEEGVQLFDVRAVGNPSSQDAPEGVVFPFGFVGFQVLGLSPGAEVGIRLLTPADPRVNGYFRFGPTFENPQPHWYSFDLEDGTGAQIGTHSSTLRLKEGARGDDNFSANELIVGAGGPAIIPGGPAVSYFPQLGNGASDVIRFQTEVNFLNPGEAATLTLEFFDSAGSGLPLTFENLQAATFLEQALGPGETLILRTDAAGAGEAELQVGYAKLTTSAEVAGNVVFVRSDVPSGTVLFEAGVPQVGTFLEASVLFDSRGFRDTGLALVNPPESTPSDQAPDLTAQVTLTLHDAEFNLLAETTFALEDGEHLARFVTEFFAAENVPTLNEMQGSVTLHSTRPLSVVALRQIDPGVPFPQAVPTLTVLPVALASVGQR